MIHADFGNNKDATTRNLAAQHAVAMPANVSPAFRIGWEDARNGDAFCPEFYFASDNRRMSYTLGFLSVRPDCTSALAMYMELVPAPAADAYLTCMADQPGWTDWRELSNDILNEKGIRA